MIIIINQPCDDGEADALMALANDVWDINKQA